MFKHVNNFILEGLGHRWVGGGGDAGYFQKIQLRKESCRKVACFDGILDI